MLQCTSVTDRRTLTSWHKREMYILHLALKRRYYLAAHRQRVNVLTPIVVDIRLRPRCCPVVSHCEHRPIRVANAWPLCVNMTPSTKPELYNLLHCRHSKDRAVATSNMHRKFGEVFTCGFSDTPANRQTDRHADRNTSHCNRKTVGRINPKPH